MARDWEAQFREWGKPPGTTEETRCENAVSAVRNAIKASQRLSSKNVTVFYQGSYRNNTNVKKDSDVDIGVVCNDVFFYDLPDGTDASRCGIVPAEYTYQAFKNDVGEALASYFGSGAVTRGNKAFDLHETTYHVDADVAPFFEYRRYSSVDRYIEGVELRTDRDSARIRNWPEQHYDNGTTKNTNTGFRYKRVVRGLKALSSEMVAAKVQGADIPGFLIECLVWNVPNTLLNSDDYSTDVRSSIIHLYNHTKEDGPCGEWGEVSELKYLFRSTQKWTRAQANDFLVAAWNYVGFE